MCLGYSMACNSLQMWNGYSSFQLVYGSNPNVPNIMTDKLPALEGTTSSEVLAVHLNVLHAKDKVTFKLKQMRELGEL